MSELIPAATAVLVRDTEQGLEVLLLRRVKALPFAGGFWVFPGGRIDDDDYPANQDLEQAAKNAVVRETQEEAQLTVHADELAHLSHWVPPKGLARSYSTWFFIAAYHRNESVEVDNSEIDQFSWLSPQQALADLAAQHIKMMAPTFITLSELSSCETVAQALAYYQNRTPIHYSATHWHEIAQGKCMLYEGDAGYHDDDPAVEGARHRLVDVDGQCQYICDV